MEIRGVSEQYEETVCFHAENCRLTCHFYTYRYKEQLSELSKHGLPSSFISIYKITVANNFLVNLHKY